MLQIGSVAAVLLIGMISGLSLLFHSNRPQETSHIVGQTLPDKEIQLINGEKIVSLISDAEIRFSADGDAFVTDGMNRNKTLGLKKDQTNKLIVPFGKRSILRLADGTKIWLNSGTELEFPSQFNGERREIRMQGELYLEVAKSGEKPFIVHTPRMSVWVYGTSFNISAYKEDSEQSVVLVEGSVQVNKNDKSLKLAPNQMAKITRTGMEKATVDVSEYISWKNGVLIFRKAPISDILQKVGRFYNIDFEYPPGRMNEMTYSGKLFLSNSLDSVMTSVSILTSMTYTRNDRMISINKKR